MGAFIVIEGIDGSGKSTVCERAAEALRSEGLRVEVTAEPTRTGVGALIRSGGAGKVSQKAESLLFVADRYVHTEEILGRVADGFVVICDRYYPSTVAYQSVRLDGDSADFDWLTGLNEDFVQAPDAVILLDVDPGTSMSRVGSRGEPGSKFETEAFLEQVRANYLRLADMYGHEVVDASGPEDEVLAQVLGIIREVLRCIRRRRSTARRAPASGARP